MAGAEVLTAPAAFTRQTGEAHWHVLLRARAIENGAFVIAAAQGGRHEDGRETYGHSIVIDPWGRVLAEVDGDEPGIAVAEIDTALVADARGKIPNLKNARDFDVVDATAPARVDATAPRFLRGGRVIHFALRCEAAGHAFDGWFRSGEDFDGQVDARPRRLSRLRRDRSRQGADAAGRRPARARRRRRPRPRG